MFPLNKLACKGCKSHTVLMKITCSYFIGSILIQYNLFHNTCTGFWWDLFCGGCIISSLWFMRLVYSYSLGLLHSLQWRYNERNDGSNHRRFDCLLTCLSRRRKKETSKLHVAGLCERNSPVTVEFSAQRPVTRKMFPFDDVILWHRAIVRVSHCQWNNPKDMVAVDQHQNFIKHIRGLDSLSGKTSYRKTSWSLEATGFGFRLFQSLWNLTSTSAAALPRCLSNFRPMWSL